MAEYQGKYSGKRLEETLDKVETLVQRLDDLGLTVNDEGYLCCTVEVSDNDESE